MFINIRKIELKFLENLRFFFCILSNISFKYCFILFFLVILYKKSYVFFLFVFYKVLVGIRAVLMEGSFLYI